MKYRLLPVLFGTSTFIAAYMQKDATLKKMVDSKY